MISFKSLYYQFFCTGIFVREKFDNYKSNSDKVFFFSFSVSRANFSSSSSPFILMVSFGCFQCQTLNVRVCVCLTTINIIISANIYSIPEFLGISVHFYYSSSSLFLFSLVIQPLISCDISHDDDKHTVDYHQDRMIG